MIRKAISCDICGTEMISANHWFVARESGAELRISIWNGQNQIRGSCRHLCGHKCLHKLLDDFTVCASQSCTAPVQTPASTEVLSRQTDSSVTSSGSSVSSRLPVISSRVAEPEFSSRPLPLAQRFPEKTPSKQHYAEAWKREQDRQQRISNHRSIA